MNEREIFLAAHKIAQTEERESFLESACRGDRALYERVLDLLNSADGVGSFLESPAPALVAALDSQDATQASGDGSVSTASELQTGTLGDFRILDEIGRGGMGVVYEAEQISLGRRVALKVLSYASILDKTKLERFKIEARAAASLDHPNVVHVHSVGSQRGVHYYAMQFIEGQTIADVIADERRRRGLDNKPGQTPVAGGSSPGAPTEEGSVTESYETPRPEAIKDTSVADRTSAVTVGSSEEKERIRRAVNLAIQAAEALEHAHRMGIVHRDIKPSNLLVDEERHLWVADFGLAMIEADGNLTATGSLMGTFRYMSPEQIQGDRHVLDHHTDIYSLGATIYEMLTLRAAFPESDPAKLIRQIPVDEPAPPRKLNPTIPRDLETIVLKAMAKDHEDRYATGGELSTDLQHFLDDEPIQAKSPNLVVRTKRWARRHRAIVMTAAATLGVAIAFAAALLWNERRRTLAAYAAVKEQNELVLRNEAEARHQARVANQARVAETEARAEADREREKALEAQIEAEAARRRADRDAQAARESERLTRQMVYAGDVRLAAQAWENGDVRHYTDLLDRLKRRDATLCGFEWSYLRQLGTADGSTLAEGTGGTCCVRHSPDGKYIAIGQHDGSIRLLNSGGHDVAASRQAHLGLVRSIDFSPDGTQMVSCADDGMVRVWSIPAYDEVLAFRGCKGNGCAALFALGGKVLLTGGEDPGLKLWDTESGEQLGTFATDEASIRTLAISPDGRYCVGSGNYQTFVWDLEEGKRLQESREEFVRCLRFSPNGEVVAMGTAEQCIVLWNILTGETIACLKGHRDDIDGLAFRPDGSLLASADRAGVIRTWPLQDEKADADAANSSVVAGKPSRLWPRCFRAHSTRAWSLDFAPSGDHFVSCSKDGTVMAWAARTSLLERPRETGALVDLVFPRSGEEVLVCESNRLWLWNRHTGSREVFGGGIAVEMFSVAFSPDEKTILCGDTDGRTHLWDREKEKVVRTVQMHDDDVDRICFTPDGRLMLTASWDGTAKLWDVGSYEELAVFRVPPHCEDAAFSPDGRLLALSSQNDAFLYEVESQQKVCVLRGHQNTADRLAFSPDGRLLATGSHDRTIRLWAVATGETIREIPAHGKKISALAFSPDGRTIASGDQGGTLAFSHVETGRFLYDLKLADKAIRELAFSPDGKSLAVAATEKVLLLQVEESATADAAEMAAFGVGGLIRPVELVRKKNPQN